MHLVISALRNGLARSPKLAWAQPFVFGAAVLLLALFPSTLAAIASLGLVMLGLLLHKSGLDSRPSAKQPTLPPCQESFEDVIARGEVLPTTHPLIYRIRDFGAAPNRELVAGIDELIDLAVAGREAETEAKLWQIVRDECRGSGDECK